MKNLETRAGDAKCRCGGCLAVETLQHKDSGPTRRGFLCSAIVGTAAMLAAGTAVDVTPASAQSTLTPDAALKEMMDGNGRYVSWSAPVAQRGPVASQGQDRREAGAFRGGALLRRFAGACRVRLRPDHRPSLRRARRRKRHDAGDHRKPRIWGRRARYQGRSWCWATAAAGRSRRPSRARRFPARSAHFTLRSDPRWIEPGPDLDAAIDANARIQASVLSQASPVLAGAIKEGNLKVVPARYDIASGKVSLLV